MNALNVLSLFLATLGPIGRIPPAPGTFGSAAAVIAAPWAFVPLSLPWRVAVLLSLFVCGAWAAGRAENVLGKKDPGQVVIDEVLGQWMTFLPLASPDLLELAVGFALFRLFDITKLPPIKASEHWLPGGYGVMIDDALAGVYAGVLLTGLHWLRAGSVL